MNEETRKELQELAQADPAFARLLDFKPKLTAEQINKAGPEYWEALGRYLGSRQRLQELPNDCHIPEDF